MDISRCNACGSALRTSLPKVRDPDSGDVFAILRCATCGLGHTSPQPDDLGRYYSSSYYGNRHSFTDRYCMRRRLRLLQRVTATLRSTRNTPKILDLGCGDGSFLALAIKSGWRGVGTEFGGNVLRGQERGIDVVGSLDDAAQSAPFDAITAWHSLEHVRDPRATLISLSGLLARDGVLIVAVPDAAGLQAKAFGANWFHLDVPRHLFHFDRVALASVLASAGFRVLESRHLEVELDVFGWMQSALNAVIPTPNVLFRSLTGKPAGAGLGTVALSYLVGTTLAPFTLPATALSALTRRGATLIAFAVKS